MKTEPIISTHIAPYVRRLVEVTPHAVMVHGNKGSNANQVATWIADELKRHHSLDAGQILYVEAEKGSISIETIRNNIIPFVKHTAYSAGVDRVIVLRAAELLTIESQNALLKLIEEPAKGVVYILSTNDADALLETIHSRVVSLRLPDITEAEALAYFADSNYSEADVKKAHAISRGEAETLEAALTGTLDEEVSRAKDFLASPVSKRLALISGIAKDKAAILSLISLLETIIGILIESAAKKQDTKSIQLLAKSHTQLVASRKQIQNNGNLKLILTNLSINI